MTLPQTTSFSDQPLQPHHLTPELSAPRHTPRQTPRHQNMQLPKRLRGMKVGRVWCRLDGNFVLIRNSLSPVACSLLKLGFKISPLTTTNRTRFRIFLKHFFFKLLFESRTSGRWSMRQLGGTVNTEYSDSAKYISNWLTTRHSSSTIRNDVNDIIDSPLTLRK